MVLCSPALSPLFTPPPPNPFACRAGPGSSVGLLRGLPQHCFLCLCRCKPKLKLRIINQNSVSVLQTPAEPDTPTEQEHGGQRSHSYPQQAIQ